MTITTTARKKTGSQVIVNTGRDKKESWHGEIIEALVHNTGYVYGNKVALYDLLGFTMTAASQEAHRWLSVPPTSSHFARIAAGLTVSSSVSVLVTGRPTSVGESVVDGEKVIGLKSESKAQPRTTGILYVRAQGLPLPVELRASSATGTRITIFSHWNEPVTLKAPSGAAPVQTSWFSPSSSHT